MIKKRNLSEELGIDACGNIEEGALDISVEKIKGIVNNKIKSASDERMERHMKTKKKLTLIAAAATLVMGITAFAASGFIAQWFSSSSSIPDYKSLPTVEQLTKDIGYEAELVEQFGNGYKFYEGSIIDNNLADEDGNSVEKFKSVMFRYEKDGDKVLFSQDKARCKFEASGEVIANAKGIDIYYFSYNNKLVPGDYELTAEDEAAQKSGELVFSYGANEPSVIKVQAVSWISDGMYCELMQADGKLSAAELAQMAKEVIEK